MEKVELLPSGTMSAETGPWQARQRVHSTFQATIVGSGSIGAVVTIQVSNDGVQPALSDPPTIEITLNGTDEDSGGAAMTAAWRFARAVVCPMSPARWTRSPSA